MAWPKITSSSKTLFENRGTAGSFSVVIFKKDEIEALKVGFVNIGFPVLVKFLSVPDLETKTSPS